MKKNILIICLLLIVNISCKKEKTENLIDTEIKPYEIELTSDNSIYTFGTSIQANNIEEANFSTKVIDINGNILYQECTITLNGSPYNKKSFKTDTPGDYVFQASIGDLKSNIYTINAYEIASKYATIVSSSIQSVNSVGLVTVGITFKNISTKKLKYINFNVECFNQVNDKIYEEISGKSSVTCQGTGFFLPDETRTLYFNIGYFTGVNNINVKLGSVTLEDGSKIFNYD